MFDTLPLWQTRFTEAMQVRQWSPCTVRRYAYELVRFFAFLEAEGVTTLAEVTREGVEAYRLAVFQDRFRGRATSARTQCSRMAAVKAFFRCLVQERYVLVNPAADVELPRTVRRLPRTLLSEAEVVRVVTAPDPSTVLGLRNRAILEVFYSTGVRNAELRAFDIQDVHFDRLEVWVREGKYRTTRLLPLGTEACHWLVRYVQEARPHLVRTPDEPALFLSLKRGRLSSEPLVAMVAAAGEKAALTRRVTPHALRHACATHMLARGASLRHLQELLGHACLDTTQRYTRVEISDLKAIHRRFHPRERTLE